MKPHRPAHPTPARNDQAPASPLQRALSFTRSMGRSRLARRIVLSSGAALVVLQLSFASFEILGARKDILKDAYERADGALDMLSATHTQAMLHRQGILDGDPAISAFNDTMKTYSRNDDSLVMWVVMGPKVLSFQAARGAREAEAARDAVDAKAIATRSEQAVEANGKLRVSRPVILGRGLASAAECGACHTGDMGIHRGEAIGAYAVEVDLSRNLGNWRALARRKLIEAGMVTLATLLTVGGLLSATTLAPLLTLTRATRRLAGGDLERDPPELDREDEIGELARALSAFRHALAAKEALEAANTHMAWHDSLTQLPNRTSFNDRLDQWFASATRDGAHIAVIGIDLNRFKEVNDRHGHAAGDALLQACASRMGAKLNTDEFLARLGGDEFAALKRYSQSEELRDFIVRLQAALSGEVVIENISLPISAAIGIARFPDDGNSRDQIINNADLAMYRSKASGEPACFYEPNMDEGVRRRRALLADLRNAVANEELFLHYQPQRSITENKVVGYESLVRWRHPARGVVPPSEFIPIAEESGLINEIGQWVLRRSCLDAATWPQNERVAINLSPRQIADVDVVRQVQEALLESGLSPRRLELEITESMIIADKQRALHVLRQLKAIGVSIAMDDFGTGYSSLETLNIFPFDKIKIDQSFIADALQRPQAMSIVKAILALGRSLEVPVLAEGVETEDQLNLLRREGCDEAQGYLLGRPAANPHSAGRLAANG